MFPPRLFGEPSDSRRHVPVAALGIAAYAVMGLLALLEFRFLTFELAQIGFFFALYLTVIEKYVLEKWCIYCLWSQGIITLIFGLSFISMMRYWRSERYTR